MEARTIGNRWADVLRHAYEAVGRGDPEPLVALLDDDVEWRGVKRGLRRRRAICRGPDETRATLRVLIDKGGLADSGNWQVHDVVQAGNRAAVTFSWRTPADTTISLAHVLRFRGPHRGRGD